MEPGSRWTTMRESFPRPAVEGRARMLRPPRLMAAPRKKSTWPPTPENCRADLLRKIYWIQECYDNLERDYLDEIDAQVRRYTRAATQKIENLTNRDQNIRGNLHTVLTARSRNRRAADLVDTIQPVFRR